MLHRINTFNILLIVVFDFSRPEYWFDKKANE